MHASTRGNYHHLTVNMSPSISVCAVANFQSIVSFLDVAKILLVLVVLISTRNGAQTQQNCRGVVGVQGQGNRQSGKCEARGGRSRKHFERSRSRRKIEFSAILG